MALRKGGARYMIKKVKEIYGKWNRGKAAQREEFQAIAESYKDIKVDT